MISRKFKPVFDAFHIVSKTRSLSDEAMTQTVRAVLHEAWGLDYTGPKQYRPEPKDPFVSA